MNVTEYWLNELAESNKLPLEIKMRKIEFPSKIATLKKISYKSLYNETIYGWLIEPKGKNNYPLVIDYIGYMNHLVSPLQFMHWLSIGCGVLVTDSRGQGGMTKDTKGYQTYTDERLMAKGFLDKNDFYLRRLYWDALRLIDVSQELSSVDQSNIFIHGTSQGGGVGLFANSLTSHKIKYGFYNVPSHSRLLNRVQEGTGSYEGIHEYLKKYPDDQQIIGETLSYFDIKNFTGMIKNPILVSVGEADPVCPKEDFYPAYDSISTYKELDVYPEPGHGGGGYQHTEKILEYLLREMER